MHYVLAGLGNPGTEYEHTRHNLGRMIVEGVAARTQATDWRVDKKARARVAQATIGAHDLLLVLPEQYMNRSGVSLAPLVDAPEELIVVHDDIDLPLGTLRIAFDRGPGGHNGVISIEQAFKSRSFTRVRVGVLPVSPEGELRKPKGEDAILHFLLKQMTKHDRAVFDHVVLRAAEAVEAIVLRGREVAMQEYN